MRLISRESAGCFSSSVCPPNEDFGTSSEDLRVCFGSTFHGCECLIRLFGSDVGLLYSSHRSDGLDFGTAMYFVTRLQDDYKKLMLPKRRFWKSEQKIERAISKHFSRV